MYIASVLYNMNSIYSCYEIIKKKSNLTDERNKK